LVGCHSKIIQAGCLCYKYKHGYFGLCSVDIYVHTDLFRYLCLALLFYESILF
jgi:hypothetical protein